MHSFRLYTNDFEGKKKQDVDGGAKKNWCGTTETVGEGAAAARPELIFSEFHQASSLHRKRAAGIRGPSGLSTSASYCLS